MTVDVRFQMVALLPRLRRFAFSLTGARDRADDLVQSTCERALRATDQWTPGTRLDSWMFRIMRNLWPDGLRKTKGEGRSEPIEEAGDPVGDDGARIAEARLTLSKVEKAMRDLPEEQRSVLALVCIKDLIPTALCGDSRGIFAIGVGRDSVVRGGFAPWRQR